MLRYLFGPVRPAFGGGILLDARQSGACCCFHSDSGADIQIALNDTWDEVNARFPPGWQPDFVVVSLDYTSIPRCLWTQPAPIVGLAPDWDLLWHHYRRQMRACDLVLTDRAGADYCRHDGLAHVEPANLAGCSRRFLETADDDSSRDIDILFLGNLNPVVQGTRHPLLARLARLSEKYRVVIKTSVSEEDYWKMMWRSRIVFNRSRHQTCNRRAFEAPGAGALLFQETENTDVAQLLPDREGCIFYRDENLEELLTHYLTHEDERQAIAQAGRERARALTFENLWADVVRRIEEKMPALLQARSRRTRPTEIDELARRSQEALVCPDRVDPQLPLDLEQAAQDQTQSASLRVLLGLVRSRYVSRDDSAVISAESAAFHFQRALEIDPVHPTAGLFLAEALDASGRRPAAIDQARQALHLLCSETRIDAALLDGGHFPLGFTVLRVEWERAAWQNAGNLEGEKRDKLVLLRFRLHTLLADWTGDPVHAYEAYRLRPDLPASSAALGLLLLRVNHLHEAIPYLKQTLERNPFHRVVARSLFAALGQVGAREAQSRLAQERELFANTAPQLVLREDWFSKIAVETSARKGAAPSLPATPRLQPRVSLTMIVRNEENNLPACLQSVRDLVDDLVVVDTGSQDRTKEAALSFGARVFDFPWIDHFAAARNESLRHANGEWILWLDADDRLDQDNRTNLRQLFSSLGDENDAYAMKVRSAMDEARTSFRILEQVRMFRRHPEIYWKYRVHEQILWAVRRLNGGVRWGDVVIDHVGYQDGAVRKSKLHRNIRLLELEAKEQPDDAFVLFNLGWTTLDLERPVEALPRLQRSLLRSAPDSSILRKLYALLIRTHRQLNQGSQAAKACAEGRTKFPDDPELLFEEAILKNEVRDPAGAADSLLRLLQIKPGRFFASVDPSLRGFKTRHMLGDLYREMGKWQEAEQQWRLAVEENPTFAPSWIGLGNLWCKAGRWEDLDRALAHLDKHHANAIETAMLRVRRHLAFKEFSVARRLVNDLIERVPQAIGPRILCTHVLLQEAKDWPTAEQALREVLRIDPNHQEARRNLQILLAKKQS